MKIQDLYKLAGDSENALQEIDKEVNSLLAGSQNKQALSMKGQRHLAQVVSRLSNLLYLDAASDGARPGQAAPTGRALRSSSEYMRQIVAALGAGISPQNLKKPHLAEKYGLLVDAMTEKGESGAEGGYLSPMVFDNMVHEKAAQALDLGDYVDVADVESFQGWRAFEEAAPVVPIEPIADLGGNNENVPLDNAEEPEFTAVPFDLVNYGGYIPVSKNLFDDAALDVLAYLARWFGKKVALRNNILITGLFDGLTPVQTDYKATFTAIKTALITTLTPDASANATIFTNQTGMKLLADLEDGVGRPLLESDPDVQGRQRYLNRPIVPVADAQWANPSAGHTQIVVGDGRDGITLFRRGAFELMRTDEGGDSWRKNGSEVRAIYRCDVELTDETALSLLNITLPS